jgi:hypothetical protein
LRIALVSNDANRRLVDEIDLGAELSGDADGLRASARIFVDQNRLGVSHF